MAHNHSNDSTLITASFPTSIMSIWERRNRDDGYSAISSEAVTVPGAANAYTVELAYGILEGATLTVTCATDGVLVAVPYENTPTGAQVAVHYDMGLLKFPAVCTGHSVTVAYTPLGSVSTSAWENTIQKELIAVQTWLSSLSRITCTTATEFAVGNLVHVNTGTTTPTAILAAQSNELLFATHVVVSVPTTTSVVVQSSGICDVLVDSAAQTTGDPRIFLSQTDAGYASFDTVEGSLLLQQVGVCLLDTRSTRGGLCTCDVQFGQVLSFGS